MNGRAFLIPAGQVLLQPQEVFWRTAAGRAYYALFLEARETLFTWGFLPSRRDNMHSFVRLRMTYAADPDLRQVGIELDLLGQLRNKADYDLHASEFHSDAEACEAVRRATDALALLDAVLADPARVVAAVADIRARWP
jgi:hypothetical protein